jgi:hypothetical protein
MSRKLTKSDARKMAAARKTKSGGRNGGRPRVDSRCPCGAMTAARAEKRRHRCSRMPCVLTV